MDMKFLRSTKRKTRRSSTGNWNSKFVKRAIRYIIALVFPCKKNAERMLKKCITIKI
jgi:hypothetical protein